MFVKRDVLNETNPRTVTSEFTQSLQNTGKALVAQKAQMKKEAAAQDGINTKLIAKIALASGNFSKIGFDAYQQEIGSDPGSIWYLSTDASGEQWLVKDVDEKGDIIRHLVSEQLPKAKKVASKVAAGDNLSNLQGTHDTTIADVGGRSDDDSLKSDNILQQIVNLNKKYVELTGESVLNVDTPGEEYSSEDDADVSSTHPEGASAYGEPTRTDVANMEVLLKTYGYENLNAPYQKYASFLAGKGLIKNSFIKTAAPEDFLLPNSAPQDDDTVKPMDWTTDSKEDAELSDEEKKDADKPEDLPAGAQPPLPNMPDPRMDNNMIDAKNDINQELGNQDGDVEIKINPNELTSFVDFPNTPSKIDEQKPGVPVDVQPKPGAPKPGIPLDMQQVDPLFDPNQPIKETRRPSDEKNPSPEVY